MLPKTFHEINPELFPDPPDDPYVYKGTTILKNKFNLRDSNELAKREFHYYLRNKNDLRFTSIKSNYDFDHFKAIHYNLFKDVYDWSGQTRINEVVDIKQLVSYCPAKDIETQTKEVFDNLKKEEHLKGLEPNKFAGRAADYYMALERIHPFRDGNARTQAEFFRGLALENGYQMDLNRVSKGDFNAAKYVAFIGSDFSKERIQNMFRDALDLPNLERYRAKIHDMKEFKTFDRDIWASKQETQGMSKAQLQDYLADKVGTLIKNDVDLSNCRDIKINIQKMEKTKSLDFHHSRALSR